MRNAAGQHAEGFELLSTRQLVLQPFALANVADNAGDIPFFLDLGGCEPKTRRENVPHFRAGRSRHGPAGVDFQAGSFAALPAPS